MKTLKALITTKTISAKTSVASAFAFNQQQFNNNQGAADS